MNRLQEYTKVSIIIPCYNEATRGDFTPRLKELHSHLKLLQANYEVIFSLDGCSDNTENILLDFIKSRQLKWNVIVNPINRGKGFAIRKGIEAANGEYILFMDADLSVNLYNLHKFIGEADKNKCIIASRYAKGAKIKLSYSTKRRIVSLLSRIMTKPLMKCKVTDPQCGFKMFPKSKIEKYLHTMKCDRWLFDVELLQILDAGKANIIEYPIEWTNMIKSTVTNTAIKDSILELQLLYKQKFKKRKEYY